MSALLVERCDTTWGGSPQLSRLRPDHWRAAALTAGAVDSSERALALAALAEAQSWDEVPAATGDRDAESGRVPPGLDAADEAVATAARSHSAITRAAADIVSAMIASPVRPEAARLLLEKAYATGAQERDGRVMGRAALHLYNVLDLLGLADEAVAMGRRTSAEVLAVGESIAGHFVAGQTTATLMDLGRWDESLDELRPALVSGRRGIAGAIAGSVASLIATRSGALDRAQRHIDRVLELVDPDFIGLPVMQIMVEWLLGCGDPQAAAADLRGRAERRAWRIEMGDLPGALGARVAADLAEQARDRRDERATEQAMDLLEEHARLFARPSHDIDSSPLGVLSTLQLEAESARCRSDPDEAGAWRRLLAHVRQSRFRWEEAYAGWRLAQALVRVGAPRPAVSEAIREASCLAVDLGAAPLVRSASDLARSAHISLDVVDRSAVRAGHRSTQRDGEPDGLAVLTEREHEVLLHVVAGRTSSEIATALFISDKTVSVHVSNILRKSGTRGRVEAAAWFGRLSSEGWDREI